MRRMRALSNAVRFFMISLTSFWLNVSLKKISEGVTGRTYLSKDPFLDEVFQLSEHLLLMEVNLLHIYNDKKGRSI
jgi:hypothetical protein